MKPIRNMIISGVYLYKRVRQRLFVKSAVTITTAIPAKNIHAARSGTGLPASTRTDILIPAISMMNKLTFVALLMSFIEHALQVNQSN